MRRVGASEADLACRQQEFEESLAEDWEHARYTCGAWRTPAGELLAVEVLPENRIAWAVFCACHTQWDLPGAWGGECRLPWTEVEATMRLMEVPSRLLADTFGRVRLLVEHAREPLMDRMRAERK